MESLENRPLYNPLCLMALHLQILLLLAKVSCQTRGGEIQGKNKGNLRTEGTACVGSEAMEPEGALGQSSHCVTHTGTALALLLSHRGVYR